MTTLTRQTAIEIEYVGVPQRVPAPRSETPARGLSRARTLSAAAVESLQRTAFVGGAPGLQLLVSPRGTRSWRLFYRLPGDRKRRALTLGRFPQVSLSVARRRAFDALDLAGSGVDPAQQRRRNASPHADRVESLFQRYIESLRHQNDPRTLYEKARSVHRHALPVLGARALAEIRRAEWVALLDGLADRPGARRTLYAYLNHFLRWAVERELLDANPLAPVRPPRPVPPRDRVLNDGELRRLWTADLTVAAIAKLSLLTMQRESAVAAINRDDLDLARAIWAAPASDMKRGKLYEVPLSTPALDLLATLPWLPGPYLFGVGSGGSRPYNGFSNAMHAMRAATGGAHWRFHDLRRTAVTLAQRAGCSIDAIKALTQHKTSGVIGVYARFDYAEEKRHVADRLAAAILEIVARR